MAITAQQQRIPIIDLRTGLITREWLNLLNDDTSAANAIAITALQTALTAALAQIAALAAQVLVLKKSDAISLEVVAQPGAVPQLIVELLQPASGGVLSEELLQSDSGGAMSEEVFQ